MLTQYATLLAEEPAPVPGADTAAFVISAPVVMFIVSALIPIINGLMTKYTLPSKVKAVITIVLNAVAAAVVTAVTVDGSAVFSNQTLLTFLYGTGISIFSYLGVYVPFNLTSSSPNGKLGPTTGIGPKVDRAA